jgi:hypothetical protein
MLRRNFLQFGLTVTISLLADATLSADETVSWGAATDSVKIGLRLEGNEHPGHLLVSIRNVGSAPRDLYLSDGEIPRIDFTATGTDGTEYKLEDRELYRPCAGLCHWPPTIKRLETGATVTVTFALDDLLYVPTKGPYTTLDGFLQKGCSLRAVFEVSEQQLKDAKLDPEFPWLGQAISAELRKH